MITCVICLDTLWKSDEDEDAIAVALGCGHIFHQRCISQWLRTQSTCPNCRNTCGRIIAPRTGIELYPSLGAAEDTPSSTPNGPVEGSTAPNRSRSLHHAALEAALSKAAELEVELAETLATSAAWQQGKLAAEASLEQARMAGTRAQTQIQQLTREKSCQAQRIAQLLSEAHELRASAAIAGALQSSGNLRTTIAALTAPAIPQADRQAGLVQLAQKQADTIEKLRGELRDAKAQYRKHAGSQTALQQAKLALQASSAQQAKQADALKAARSEVAKLRAKLVMRAASASPTPTKAGRKRARAPRAPTEWAADTTAVPAAVAPAPTPAPAPADAGRPAIPRQAMSPPRPAVLFQGGSDGSSSSCIEIVHSSDDDDELVITGASRHGSAGRSAASAAWRSIPQATQHLPGLAYGTQVRVAEAGVPGMARPAGRLNAAWSALGMKRA